MTLTAPPPTPTPEARPGRVRPPSTGPFTTARGLLPLIAVCLVLFALPIVMLAVGAFRNAPPGSAARWSFSAFGRAYADAETYRTLLTSVLLSGAGTVLAVVVALVLTFLVARTATPLRRIVTPAMVLVVALPPLFYAISVGMLGNPRIGMANTVFRELTGSTATLFDANSWTGLLLVACVKGAAVSYLLLLGPFRALDRSLEEASQIAGAGRLRTLLGIDLPMLAPAISGVVILNFVIGLESFDAPLFLGTPAGIDVFATRVYSLIYAHSPEDYGAASALSLLLVVVVVGLVFLQYRLLGRRTFTTVTGKSYRTEAWDIGAWKWVGTAFIVVYLLIAIAAPLTQLVLGSLQPFFGGGAGYSTANYAELFADPDTVDALGSTFLVALLGGLLAMVLALTISYAVTHSSSRLRRLLDLLTWLPWAVPGVVLALGVAWAFVSIPGVRELYGTIWIVLVGLVVTAIPIATRAVQPALMQINRELEEAGRTSGGSPRRVFAGIVLPLIAPSFLAGWFVVAIVVSGNLAVPILLSSQANTTVPLLVYRLYTTGETSQAAALFVVVLGALLVGFAVVAALSAALRRLTRPAHPAPTGGSSPS